MNEIILTLDTRTLTGKHAAKLRMGGFIPSVVYGGKSKPVSTQSPMIETAKVARAAGKHTPVRLVINGKKKLAIIKNIDLDPVKRHLRHVAFHTIKQNETITTEVPIVLVGIGESVAEREGLVVLQAIEKIEIKALPANLPDSIEVSIVDLTSTDDKITIESILLPDGVEFNDNEQDMSLVVANVYEPSALQSANEAAGGEAEVEVEVESENGGEDQSDETEDESELK